MVSFSCEGCGDVLTKKKLDSHKGQCHGASFTCLDCMIHFQGTEYRGHTSCISEAQKYQGALYRPEKENKGKANARGSRALVPQKAYVEDAYDDDTGAIAIVDPPPEAPTPPSAAPNFRHLSPEEDPEDDVNVFDFLVGSETPNPSTLNLTAVETSRMIEDSPANPPHQDAPSPWYGEEMMQDEMDSSALVQYGNGPVPTTEYRTPAPKAERQRKIKIREPSKDEQKDKKRKRLHVDTSGERSQSREADEDMTDAPPVLHSGLTGGLNRLLHPSTFPPSPDYSGDAAEPSPGSPLKRSKHSKRREARKDNHTISNGIMSLIGTRKSSKKTHASDDRIRKQKSRRIHGKSSDQKMIEYKPMNAGAGENGGQMVVYKESARAELFMGLINKGPESEKGCSMNKTLKRYHRERAALGRIQGKGVEEKELWRSLRLRRNDRGEIVVFCPGK